MNDDVPDEGPEQIFEVLFYFVFSCVFSLFALFFGCVLLTACEGMFERNRYMRNGTQGHTICRRPYSGNSQPNYESVGHYPGSVQPNCHSYGRPADLPPPYTPFPVPHTGSGMVLPSSPDTTYSANHGIGGNGPDRY